jgi:hypothetical protein
MLLPADPELKREKTLIRGAENGHAVVTIARR